MEEQDKYDVEKGSVSASQATEIEEGQYYTVSQVAHLLRYSSHWIMINLQRGRIHGVKPTGGCWRIPASVVNRMKNEGIPPLPRKVLAVESKEIVVEGKHAERVKSKEEVKREEEERERSPFSWLFD